MQDYAFTQGFSVVTYSSSENRLRIKCNRHEKSTRNTRKILEEERKRVNTKVNAHQCPYEVYVSKRNKEDVWHIGISNEQHNHPRDSDPFNFLEHRHRDPQRQRL